MCLLQVLYFIDDSPVLSILDDFLPQLDAFFLNQEEVLQKCVESCYQQPPPVRSGNLGIDREDPMNQDSANSKALRECLVQVSSEELALNGGPALAGVDERYVEALELSCLLRQRLMDVRHNWRSVVSKSLCDHGRYKGTIILNVKKDNSSHASLFCVIERNCVHVTSTILVTRFLFVVSWSCHKLCC